MKIKKLMLVKLAIIAMLGANAQSTANNFPASGNSSLGTANYLTSGRMYFHGYSADPQNDNNRGTLANNLYWDYTLPGWTTSTLSTNDFSVLRFENSGDLGFYTKPNESGLTSPLTYTDISPYKRMVIKNNGYIGIGTASPLATLHVDGGKLFISSTTGSTYGQFQITNPNDAEVSMSFGASGTGLISASNLYGRQWTVGINSYGAGLSSFTITNPNLTNKGFVFTTSGNLLIGKNLQANPIYKLDVDGPVHATRVVVNSDGADYVFDSSYNLRSLDEVESFIKTNHHLPEIAHAADMQANGIDIGNNQTKLLQKTEELTLYLIEQNKQLKEQLEINTAQNKKMQELTEQNQQLKEQVSEIEVLKQLIARQQEAIEALQQKTAEAPNDNKD